MLGGQFQGRGGAAAGFDIIAALEGQPGQMGLKVRLFVGQRLEGLDRRRGLALRLQAGGPAQCGLGRSSRLRLVDLGRFLVATVHQQRTGFAEIGGRRGKRNDE